MPVALDIELWPAEPTTQEQEELLAGLAEISGVQVSNHFDFRQGVHQVIEAVYEGAYAGFATQGLKGRRGSLAHGRASCTSCSS